MSRIISFAWTSPALLAGHKTVTRRDWKPDYGRSFEPLEIVTAYDRSPRIHGKPIATLRLLTVAYEWNSDAPDEDYAA